ncbi:cation:proton antiporter [Marinobacter sp. SS5-14b]|uniref:cation:proton antiporter domain-containing protein n=1 Tax=Marinobacter sp. SS5-14b TaxID=3050456 RepID=UPI0026DFEA3F|nr:cation:proton antiporter [Marinobacter sp. SS5-14b]
MDDFLGLGLIGLTYGVCLLINAWVFLLPPFPCDNPKSLWLGMKNLTSAGVRLQPLERLSELVLVVLVGGMLFTDSWSLRAVSLGLFFLVVLPVSVFLGLLCSGAPWRLQMLVGWFGVRGTSSLYYLMFAVVFGLPEELALELTHITLVVVVLSIIIHGLTVKPMMTRWWGALKAFLHPVCACVQTAQLSKPDPGKVG